MGSLDGYTGPTSGRITIGGGSGPVVERFTDPPLTADEARAVAWFTALSPNEQLREVRRLKWNADERERGRDTWKEAAQRLEAENARLRAERDARRPDGYELPRSAAELLRAAEEAPLWRSARSWTVEEDGQHAMLLVRLRGPVGWEYTHLRWDVPLDGNGAGRLVSPGLYRHQGKDWSDTPSLKEIRRVMRTV